MTKEIALPRGRAIANFDPKAARRADKQADALLKYAAEVKDFTLIETAVDAKLTNQEEFVGWWSGNVRGKGKKANSADRRYFVEEAEQLSEIKHQQVSRWARRLLKRDEYRASLVSTAYKKAMGEQALGESRAGALTRETEWYTPAEYIEASRRVLGEIDLDPASNEFAQQVVRAAQFFDEPTDGLMQAWNGRVFLNPPYKHPQVEWFVQKLVDSYHMKTVSAAVLLTNNATDTNWWHVAARACRAICFTRGRISFYQRDGQKNSPTHGQTFFYFGDDVEVFAGEFAEFGLVR